MADTDDFSLLRPYHLNMAISLAGSDSASLADTLNALNALREDAGRVYPCPKCGTDGVHPRSLNTNNPADTDLISCTLLASNDSSIACAGWGYTTSPVRAQVTQYIADPTS